MALLYIRPHAFSKTPNDAPNDAPAHKDQTPGLEQKENARATQDYEAKDYADQIYADQIYTGQNNPPPGKAAQSSAP